MAEKSPTVATRVPQEIRSGLTALAKAEGKRLGPYLTELLTQHVTRGGRPSGPPKAPRPEPPPPALERETFQKLTEALGLLTTTLTEHHEADAAEREDFYRALLAIFFAQFRALESTSFTEEKVEKFLDQNFRKPLLGED